MTQPVDTHGDCAKQEAAEFINERIEEIQAAQEEARIRFNDNVNILERMILNMSLGDRHHLVRFLKIGERILHDFDAFHAHGERVEDHVKMREAIRK